MQGGSAPESGLPFYDQTDLGIRLIEEERRRIARDLHAGPGKALSRIGAGLDRIRQFTQTDPKRAQDELNILGQEVVRAMNELTQLLYELRPVAVDEVGLASATHALCQRCKRDWRIPFDVRIDDGFDRCLSPARQVALYRLIQAALDNVGKHAHARNVSVFLTVEKGAACVAIVDDGRGFDIECVSGERYGISGLREQTAYLGCELRIESRAGAGCRVEFRFAPERGS